MSSITLSADTRMWAHRLQLLDHSVTHDLPSKFPTASQVSPFSSPTPFHFAALVSVRLASTSRSRSCPAPSSSRNPISETDGMSRAVWGRHGTDQKLKPPTHVSNYRWSFLSAIFSSNYIHKTYLSLRSWLAPSWPVSHHIFWRENSARKIPVLLRLQIKLVHCKICKK